MFTGLVEEIGKIKAVRPLGGGVRIAVTGKKVVEGLKIDDSIAVNGVCQTVVAVEGADFEVEAIEETLRKTTFRDLKPGTDVNLERALCLNGRLGGHIVQGHVDTVGRIKSVIKEKTGINICVSYPAEFSKWVVARGSICIEGVSLTVAHSMPGTLTVSVIPHTWSSTVLRDRKPSSEVNLEFDILGKYVENMVGFSNSSNRGSLLDQYIDQPEF